MLYQTLKSFAWLSLVAAVLFWSLAVYFTWDSYVFERDSVVTIATIVDLAVEEDEGSTYYRPIFSFEDPRGHTVTVHSRSKSRKPLQYVGQQLQVWFMPTDPMEARINEWDYIWGGPAALALGGFMFLMGFIMMGFVVPRLLKKPAAGESAG